MAVKQLQVSKITIVNNLKYMFINIPSDIYNTSATSLQISLNKQADGRWRYGFSKLEVVFCAFQAENDFVNALIQFIWARIIRCNINLSRGYIRIFRIMELDPVSAISLGSI